jgi:hypothetical protein
MVTMAHSFTLGFIVGIVCTLVLITAITLMDRRHHRS